MFASFTHIGSHINEIKKLKIENAKFWKTKKKKKNGLGMFGG